MITRAFHAAKKAIFVAMDSLKGQRPARSQPGAQRSGAPGNTARNAIAPKARIKNKFEAAPKLNPSRAASPMIGPEGQPESSRGWNPRLGAQTSTPRQGRLNSPANPRTKNPVSSTLLVATLLFATACNKPASTSTSTTPEKLLAPDHGAYTGAYIDFGDTEDDVTIEKIEGFEKLVGKHQAIVACSSYWGEQSFPTANLQLIWDHGSVPLLFWSPWDRPYNEDQGPDKFSLANIAAGKWDTYIDHWADAAKAFGHPVMVSFANEMNGEWFPWSGNFFGGDKEIAGFDPPPYNGPEYLRGGYLTWWGSLGFPRHVGPELFKAAYRHLVDRVRARGATNVIWVFHFMNYSMPQEMWNLIANYYPGDNYVDWLGMSVYGQQYVEDNWSSFQPLLDWPYSEITALAPNKPIMLAEWGIGEFPQFGSKSGFISEAFRVIRRYPKIKAAVFWNERWQNEPTVDADGIYHDGGYSNLRVNSSPESLAAYRKGVGDKYWLGYPMLYR
jgi:hypothetical protein